MACKALKSSPKKPCKQLISALVRTLHPAHTHSAKGPGRLRRGGCCCSSHLVDMPTRSFSDTYRILQRDCCWTVRLCSFFLTLKRVSLLQNAVVFWKQTPRSLFTLPIRSRHRRQSTKAHLCPGGGKRLGSLTWVFTQESLGLPFVGF